MPAGPVVPVTAQFGTAARARGTAVMLADGRALTAAHVVDEASIREALCLDGRWPAEEATYLSTLRVGPGQQPATRVAIGQSRFRARGCDLAYQGGEDLALLRLDEPRAGAPAATLCPEDAAPGAAVVVVTRDRRVPARLAGVAEEVDPQNGSYAVLPIRLELGESGAGVFDATRGCLLGIVSQRAFGQPEHSWMVRTGTIRAFLARAGGA